MSPFPDVQLVQSKKAYIRSSLLSNLLVRLDGCALEDHKPIALETGVDPLANENAKVCIAHPGRGYVHEAGGAEVVIGMKLS